MSPHSCPNYLLTKLAADMQMESFMCACKRKLALSELQMWKNEDAFI